MSEEKMRPMIIAPEKLFPPESLDLLRKNGICIVECSDPSKVKFVDPLPAVSSRNEMERAAIKLSRILLNGQWGQYTPSSRADFCRIYIDCLTTGTELDSRGGPSEHQEALYSAEFQEETRRLARADAKAARLKRIEESKKTTNAPKTPA